MKLYKYMPLRKEFFEDPLLRLTPPSALNDPFDSKPTDSGIERKSVFFFEPDPLDDEKTPSKQLQEYYKRDLETGLEQYGIISLTENPYSLLMWAHYADEHRGMVIELSCDEATFNYHDKYTKTCGVSQKIPNRVIYSSRRPGYELHDDVIYDYYEDKFFTHYALIKGDDWMYEKEHRYILRESELDAVIFDVNSHDSISKLKHDHVVITCIKDLTYKVTASAPAFCDHLHWWLCLAEGKGLVHNTKIFKRINKNSIKTIYFGCKITDHQVDLVRKTILGSQFINHDIPLFKASANKNRFEINFQLLK